MNVLAQIQKDLTKARKTDIETISKTVIHQVKEGEVSAIDVLAKIKPYQIIIEKISKDEAFKQALIDELNKEDGKSKVSLNMNIKMAQTSTKDYSGDAVWAELKAALKEREDFLNTIPAGGIETANEDGELIRIYPPAKKVSEYAKCEFA